MIDLSAIRLEQAKYLKKDAKHSAIIVSGIVFYVSILLIASGRYKIAGLWVSATLAMIGVTLLYARFRAVDGVTSENYRNYLRGHVVITFCSGVVWGLMSLIVLDYQSLFSLFISVTIATSITVGGMFPGNSYRPAYVALAVPTILFLAGYIVFTAPLPIRYFGIGIMLYFAFALLSSAKAELATRDWIISKTQKKLANSVVAHSEEVRQVYDLKSKFLATASHDLSQPLHAQGHYIEALRQTSASQEQSEIIEKIAQTWRAQKDMLGDLVNVMRLDGGMIQPKLSTFDLGVLLQDLLTELTLEAKRQGLVINSRLPKAFSLYSDPVFLRRIVSNALSNTMKHAKDGGELLLEVDSDEDHVYIRLKDRGPGFHVEGNVLNTPIEVRRGGVGLTSIENISKLINAHPSLSNRDDGPGSVFTLKLPREKEQAAHGSKGLSASSVLVIDDDRNILDAVTVLFTQWGVQTLSADSVADALLILDSTRIELDLLIVDNRLSADMDSVAAISAIRAVTRPDLPAVVVSGDVYAPSRLAELDGVEILPKPVEARSFQNYFGL